MKPQPHITNPVTRGWLNRTMAKIGTQIGKPPTLAGDGAEHFRAVARAAVGFDDLARAVMAGDASAVEALLILHGYRKADQ